MSKAKAKAQDHELIELAAEAAQIGGWSVQLRDTDGGVIVCYHYAKGTETMRWNPLEDDGDALRLAVKLDLQIAKSSCGTTAIAFRPIGLQINEPIKDDPYAATRRAIVKAAAEIGVQKRVDLSVV